MGDLNDNPTDASVIKGKQNTSDITLADICNFWVKLCKMVLVQQFIKCTGIYLTR